MPAPSAGTGGNVVQDQIISSIPNPLVSNPLVSNPLVSNQALNPLVSNATFALAPPAESSPGSGASADAGLGSPGASAVVPPQDDTAADFDVNDAVFVTLRAYQIVRDGSARRRLQPADQPRDRRLPAIR